MPKPFPAEFCRDVIAVARQRGDTSIAQIARDFSISKSRLDRWLAIADREDGLDEPVTAAAPTSEAEVRELRRREATGAGEGGAAAGDGIFRPRRSPKMTYPMVGDLAADGIPVALSCGVLGLSKQAYYKCKANPVCDRDWSDAHLINAALDIHHDDPGFGYRFIVDELGRIGTPAGRNRVKRLCCSESIRCTHASAAATATQDHPSTTTWLSVSSGLEG